MNDIIQMDAKNESTSSDPRSTFCKVLGTVRAKILDNLYLNPNETFKRNL